MTDDTTLIAERREKLAAIRRQGIAFPNDFKPRHHAAELMRLYDALTNEELEALRNFFQLLDEWDRKENGEQ